MCSRAATEQMDSTQMLSLAVWLSGFLLFKLGWVLKEGEGRTELVSTLPKNLHQNHLGMA